MCLDYDGSKYRLYHAADGDTTTTMVGSNVASYTMIDPGFFAPSLTIGANGDNDNFWYQGYIDEIRLTNGTARYANDSGAAVPTAPFPRDGS